MDPDSTLSVDTQSMLAQDRGICASDITASQREGHSKEATAVAEPRRVIG